MAWVLLDGVLAGSKLKLMLGQPVTLLVPEVVGVCLSGELSEGVITDLTLRITEMLRQHGVVGKFVEFYGPGTKALSLPDRATIANMAPEHGATMGFFQLMRKQSTIFVALVGLKSSVRLSNHTLSHRICLGFLAKVTLTTLMNWNSI